MELISFKVIPTKVAGEWRYSSSGIEHPAEVPGWLLFPKQKYRTLQNSGPIRDWFSAISRLYCIDVSSRSQRFQRGYLVEDAAVDAGAGHSHRCCDFDAHCARFPETNGGVLRVPCGLAGSLPPVSGPELEEARCRSRGPEKWQTGGRVRECTREARAGRRSPPGWRLLVLP